MSNIVDMTKRIPEKPMSYHDAVKAIIDAPPHYQIAPNPIPMILYCPSCSFQHVDNDYWSRTPHDTHMCESCRYEWRPCAFNTVGVAVLPVG